MLTVSLGRQKIQAENLQKVQIKSKTSGTQRDHYRIWGRQHELGWGLNRALGRIPMGKRVRWGKKPQRSQSLCWRTLRTIVWGTLEDQHWPLNFRLWIVLNARIRNLKLTEVLFGQEPLKFNSSLWVRIKNRNVFTHLLTHCNPVPTTLLLLLFSNT